MVAEVEAEVEAEVYRSHHSQGGLRIPKSDQGLGR